MEKAKIPARSWIMRLLRALSQSASHLDASIIRFMTQSDSCDPLGLDGGMTIGGHLVQASW